MRRVYLPSLVVMLIAFAAGPSRASFRLFDHFEDETVGSVAGQDGWSSNGGDNRIVVDPADAGNQVLYVPSESSVLRKSLLEESVGVPDGTARMLFMRIRVGDKQTFSVGLSGFQYPHEFDDFAPEIGMANSTQNLDLRAWDDDGGNYEIVVQLLPDVWYNVWVLVDASRNDYQIWLNDVPGASATAADKLSAADEDETFDFRAGRNSDLVTFYVKTAGGSSGTNFGPVYFDDVYVELMPALNLTNPAVPNSAPEVRGLVFREDRETLLWNALPWADGYDVVRGDLHVLRDWEGNFTLSVTSCLDDGVVDDTTQDPETPHEGEGFFYVVRGATESGDSGTYDTDGSGQADSRDPGVDASPAACP